jgi:DNA processing protein
MKKDSLLKWLQLSLTYGVGPATFLKLIQHFGTVEAVYEQNINVLSSIVSKGIAAAILKAETLEQAQSLINWQQQDTIRRHIITLNDDCYPETLAEIDQPPVILFAEGNIDLLSRNKIAIVGTRHPTNYGIENARNFAETLANNGLTVVSGLAAGIDRFAHEGALKSQSSTIAVIGTGLDIVYPASNRAIFQQIREHGLIISEFPLGTPPINNNFPRRNRIIVGLSQACLVVESAIDGGSMISANFALETGRDVIAIPGSIHNPMARGCHKLIKQGAKLCETANDVLDELKLIINNNISNSSNHDTDDVVLLAMGFEPILLDHLCVKLNLDFSVLCGKLLELELDEKIINCGGGRYQRLFK